jgi:hypothetical protein
MKKSVKVTANEKGQVINQSSNPEYGYIRVEQEQASFENGWMRTRTRSALISAPIKDLKEFGFKAGQELPGNIIAVEQLTPFNEETPERDLKIAGDTGVVCTVGGKEIYRKTFYTDNEEAEDILIDHDNHEEISQRRKELEASSLATQEEGDL